MCDNSKMAAIITTRKKVIAIILDILIWGLGHVSVGRTKRGIGILLLGLAIMIVASSLIHYLSILVGIAYLAWLISDLLKIVKSINKQAAVKVDSSSVYGKEKTCRKCGNINPEDSSFCIKCGSALK
jgi:threonine/homoserine/homoserine lactone efflux protein